MKFKLDIEKQSGVKIGFWVIDEMNISPTRGKAEAKLLGYVSEELYLSGKAHEIEHHVYFEVDKSEAKLTSLVQALTSVIQNKFIEDRNPKEIKESKR